MINYGMTDDEVNKFRNKCIVKNEISKQNTETDINNNLFAFISNNNCNNNNKPVNKQVTTK